MTKTAALALRRLDRSEVQPFLPQLNEWLLPDARYHVQHTWPQLYRSDGDGNFLGLFDSGRLLSHCAWRLVTVRTAAGPQCVALLGSVATDPLARGHGHASRLLDVAVDDCMRAGAAAVLLWAERAELYARAGFEPGPTESCCVLTRGARNSDGVRFATVADHAALARLHAQKPLGVERSVHAMSGLLTTPGMWTCVLVRGGDVVAYACCGKGADLQGWWHEVGGSDADVAALLPAAAALAELEQSLVLVPPYRPRLASLLGSHCVETATVPGPMVCLLRGETLPALWIDGLDSV